MPGFPDSDKRPVLSWNRGSCSLVTGYEWELFREVPGDAAPVRIAFGTVVGDLRVVQPPDAAHLWGCYWFRVRSLNSPYFRPLGLVPVAFRLRRQSRNFPSRRTMQL